MWVERIGQPARTPWLLAFDPDVLMILRSTLQAASPQEGCALLIGERVDRGWQLQSIWPCVNVWRLGMEAFVEESGEGPSGRGTPSRQTRFAIDPREQLHAQRWASARGLAVIGSAHSHPDGEPVPSMTDQRWLSAPALMLIQGADLSLRAWWLEPDPVSSFGVVQHTEG